MISNEVIDKVIASMKSSVDVEYFFSKLNKPDWIQPLFDKKLFNDPPAPIVDGGYITTPSWPISQYLVRMSDKAPDIVSEVILKIPETDNERIHQDYAQAALNMPPEHAVKIAKLESIWIKKTSYFYILYPEYIGKLVSYLVDNNQADIAFLLAANILALKQEIKESGDPGSDDHFIDIEVIPKFSQWWYIKMLEKNIPSLVNHASTNYKTLKLLCGLLKQALDKGEGSNDDYSYLWRSFIGESSQNSRHHEIRDGLLVAVRDAAIAIVNSDKSKLGDIIEIIMSFNSVIFERIAFYILSEFPSESPDLTSQYLGSKEWFQKRQLRVEYACLARNGFQYLSDADKSKIMSWIDEGPDLDKYSAWYKESHNEEPPKELLVARKKIWQRDRLDQFKDHLGAAWTDHYQSLIAELGAPDSPEYLYKHSVSWVGPTSPMTVDEINELDVEALVQNLKEWQPSGASMDPSPEGLSRNLSEAIKTNIDKFKDSASLFKGLSPTYVRGVFQGFRDNHSKLDKHSWSGIIDLCAWVLSQDYDIEAEQEDIDSDEDPGWSWCRKTIASLLDSGLKKGDGQIPIDLKEQVWPLIHSLTQDPDPTPAHETEYGGSNMGPSTMAINTVRGEAMHALVEYGLWIARNTPDKQINFDYIPEMRQVLDERLNPEIDPSLAIRSVYGQFFPWLNLLDTNWASEAKTRIFSDDELGLGDAAWDAYITFCQPYDDTFKVIPDMYLKYAQKLSDANEDDERDRSLEHFASHIITFYWRSKLELGDDMIQAFYTHAPLRLRKKAIEFIGRSLGNTRDGLEENIEQRLKALYEWRQAEADKSGEYEELAEFCWWVDADIVNREWVLTKFHELLKVLDKLDSLDFAARRLGNYLEVNPSMVLECMDMMVDKLKTPGMYFTWDDAAQDILREALLLDDVKDQAVALVHKFGSRGFLKYRELLNQ